MMGMSGKRQFVATLISLFCWAAVAAPKNERSNPTFGKDYKAGILQKAVLPETTAASPAPPAEGLNLEAPQLEAKKDEGFSAGPINNLNLRCALDLPMYFPRPGAPTERHLGMANFDIHVAELFLTTNVGDHISVLAEQLLVTSKMGDMVGQDHGFVYAIFSNIPGLPENWSLKAGRTRFRFGVDARLDSPASTLRSPVYKTLGTITDKGIELSGYSGPIEWSLGVMNGVDSIEVPVVTKTGEEATVEMDTRNGSKPVVARVSADVTDWFGLGVSGFSGKTYPVYSHYGLAMHDLIFNGHTDEERLIYKNRGAVDAKLKLGSRLDLSGEYAFGNDRDEGQSLKVWSAFGRLDYRIIPSKLSAQIQYEYFNDGRDVVITEGQPYKDSGNVGLGVVYYLTDQSWIRLAWLQDDRGLFRTRGGDPKAPEYMSVLQTIITY